MASAENESLKRSIIDRLTDLGGGGAYFFAQAVSRPPRPLLFLLLRPENEDTATTSLCSGQISESITLYDYYTVASFG